MHLVDLRSDTVTLPTEAMRLAMATAELGDDVFGEDPTVVRLEALAAEMTGKEAAMLVPSGTMANLICLLTHCGRGEEVILGDQAHIFYYEQGGSAAVGGIHPRTVPNHPDGTLDRIIERDLPAPRLIAADTPPTGSVRSDGVGWRRLPSRRWGTLRQGPPSVHRSRRGTGATCPDASTWPRPPAASAEQRSAPDEGCDRSALGDVGQRDPHRCRQVDGRQPVDRHLGAAGRARSERDLG